MRLAGKSLANFDLYDIDLTENRNLYKILILIEANFTLHL